MMKIKLLFKKNGGKEGYINYKTASEHLIYTWSDLSQGYKEEGRSQNITERWNY